MVHCIRWLCYLLLSPYKASGPYKNGQGQGHPTICHETHEGSKDRAQLFLQPRYINGTAGQRHVPAALPRWRTRCPIKEVRGPQGRSGEVPPTGVRTPHCLVRGKLLYSTTSFKFGTRIDSSLLQNAHTASGAHPASYSMDTGVPPPSSHA